MKTSIVIFFGALVGCGGAPVQEESASELADTTKADGKTWCHENLSLTGGTDAVFDYQVTESTTAGNQSSPGTYRNDATSVWLNVKNDQFHDGDSAQAVVQTYSYSAECGSFCRDNEFTLDKQYIVGLKYESGRLTAPLQDLPLTFYVEGDDQAFVYFWELAITANGNWYKGSDGNNIRAYVTDSPEYCAQGHTL